MSNNTKGLCPFYLLNSDTSEIIKTVALGLLGIFSFIGNALVLVVLCRNREMRTVTNLFIANMAVSDLIFPLIVIPKEIVFQHTEHLWLVKGSFGLFLCKIVHFVQDISTSVSIFSHVAISIERFYAVVFPLKARGSSVAIRTFAVVMTWVVAMGYYALYFYSFKVIVVSKEKDTFRCVNLWGPPFGHRDVVQERFYLVSFITHYAVPLVVIAILYMYLLHKIKARQVVGNDYNDRVGRDSIQNKRIVRLAICIVTIFAISWAPIHIVFFVYIYKWKWSVPCGLENLTFAAFYLGWLSTLTNPLIYFIFSENYRNGLRNLLAGFYVIHPRIFPGSNAGGTETVDAGYSDNKGLRALRSERNVLEETMA